MSRHDDTLIVIFYERFRLLKWTPLNDYILLSFHLDRITCFNSMITFVFFSIIITRVIETNISKHIQTEPCSICFVCVVSKKDQGIIIIKKKKIILLSTRFFFIKYLSNYVYTVTTNDMFRYRFLYKTTIENYRLTIFRQRCFLNVSTIWGNSSTFLRLQPGIVSETFQLVLIVGFFLQFWDVDVRVWRRRLLITALLRPTPPSRRRLPTWLYCIH